ncbi:MAG: hypothetical protein KatS3mg031_0080 [Chitinophagales bacterium]|nr:MAG: hypothetical protein KatS3mg031_0080 [Chitinophagales bacterium]
MILRFLPPAAVCLLFLTGCLKGDDQLKPEELNAAIEYAISSGTGGMAAQFDDVLIALQQAEAGKTVAIMRQCNTVLDSTVIRADTLWNLFYTYVFHWSYLLTCDAQDDPISFRFDYDGSGSFDAPRMSGSGQVNARYNVTGLSPSDNAYLYNGTYMREGNLQSKAGRQIAFSILTTVVLQDVRINKSNRKIISGSALLTVSGELSNGQGFNYEGSMIFPGNGSVTVTVNGRTFTFTL